MKIYEQCLKEENELLNQYKSQIKGMVFDGVVSWEDYLQSKKKILFVLKEVNGGENWDLREFLRGGGRPDTWNNITRWMKGIRNLDKELKWAEIENISDGERVLQLKSIAAINVKKTSGRCVADSVEVYKSAMNNKELLKEQVNLYNPDLVICCGTGNEYFDFICENKEFEWKSTTRGVWYVIDGEKVIINFNHPAARVSPSFLYYGLIDALREIYKND